MKEIILPAIEQEVNEGKNFAQLRQIYRSLILAVWFKQKLKESIVHSPQSTDKSQPLLTKIYIDKKKIKGVDSDDPKAKEKVYQLYVQAYKNGLYNYIKKDYDSQERKQIKRRYYSGGADLRAASSAITALPISKAPGSASELSSSSSLSIRLTPSDSTTRKEEASAALAIEQQSSETARAASSGVGEERLLEKKKNWLEENAAKIKNLKSEMTTLRNKDSVIFDTLEKIETDYHYFWLKKYHWRKETEEEIKELIPKIRQDLDYLKRSQDIVKNSEKKLRTLRQEVNELESQYSLKLYLRFPILAFKNIDVINKQKADLSWVYTLSLEPLLNEKNLLRGGILSDKEIKGKEWSIKEARTTLQSKLKRELNEQRMVERADIFSRRIQRLNSDIKQLQDWIETISLYFNFKEATLNIQELQKIPALFQNLKTNIEVIHRPRFQKPPYKKYYDAVDALKKDFEEMESDFRHTLENILEIVISRYQLQRDKPVESILNFSRAYLNFIKFVIDNKIFFRDRLKINPRLLGLDYVRKKREVGEELAYWIPRSNVVEVAEEDFQYLQQMFTEALFSIVSQDNDQRNNVNWALLWLANQNPRLKVELAPLLIMSAWLQIRSDDAFRFSAKKLLSLSGTFKQEADESALYKFVSSLTPEEIGQLKEKNMPGLMEVIETMLDNPSDSHLFYTSIFYKFRNILIKNGSGMDSDATFGYLSTCYAKAERGEDKLEQMNIDISVKGDFSILKDVIEEISLKLGSSPERRFYDRHPNPNSAHQSLLKMFLELLKNPDEKQIVLAIDYFKLLNKSADDRNSPLLEYFPPIDELKLEEDDYRLLKAASVSGNQHLKGEILSFLGRKLPSDVKVVIKVFNPDLINYTEKIKNILSALGNPSFTISAAILDGSLNEVIKESGADITTFLKVVLKPEGITPKLKVDILNAFTARLSTQPAVMIVDISENLPDILINALFTHSPETEVAPYLTEAIATLISWFPSEFKLPLELTQALEKVFSGQMDINKVLSYLR